eukprot:TRINITY_DN66958_c8_g1_i2.p1 TRINITY_DN66958_c8_g1~~TRINITY_DN66958_c8_g1_i2.p1  ORF type:complete len:670 (+),score=365.83 TRINITY_DN66958_c8_g1_i2:85-2094(+)
MSSRKQYKDAARLFGAVDLLFTQFSQYNDIPQINKLLVTVEGTKRELQQVIFQDFRDFRPSGGIGMMDSTIEMLHDGCSVIDVLGGDSRAELLDWFCERQLASYTPVFGPGMEGGTLDQTERRYSWWRRMMKEYEDTYQGIFPRHWHVPAILSKHFCDTTRGHLTRILQAEQGEFDVNVLIKTLQKTIDFEKALSVRYRMYGANGGRGGGRGGAGGGAANLDRYFDSDEHEAAAVVEAIKSKYADKDKDGAHHGGGGGGAGAGAGRGTANINHRNGDQEVSIDFTNIISQCFMPHLGGYVQLERGNIRELIERINSEEVWLPNDVDTNKPRLAGSDELLLYIKKSMKRCAKLTRGKIFFNIVKEYERGMLLYIDVLRSHLCNADDPNELDRAAILSHCQIINTAEYFMEILPDLQTSIVRIIDEDLADQVDLSPEIEQFGALAQSGVTSLVAGIHASLSKHLTTMVKMPWATWEEVGDTSAYVHRIQQTLQSSVSVVASAFSRAYFINFCTTLVEMFVPQYVENIFKCKRINDLAGQQLALDAHSLKNIIMDVPNTTPFGSDEEKSQTVRVPRRFKRFVTNEMGKAEYMLKTLVSPPERIIQTYVTLLPDEAKSARAAEQLARLMDLRGIRRSDQQQLIATYNSTCAPADRITAATESPTTIRKLFSFK